MAKTIVSIQHSDEYLGTPGNYTHEHVEKIKDMIRKIADDTRGGMQNIVHKGDVVFIKVNTVNTSPPDNGFTTDPRMLEALIEVVKEQEPAKVQVGERCALGQDTMTCFEVCGLKAVADRTGAELSRWRRPSLKCIIWAVRAPLRTSRSRRSSRTPTSISACRR